MARALTHRLVTVVGPPGCGKTAVAIAAANYLSERRHESFADGVFFVSLSRAGSVAEVLGAIAREAGLPDASEGTVLGCLQRWRCLLVWDDPMLGQVCGCVWLCVAVCTHIYVRLCAYVHECMCACALFCRTAFVICSLVCCS